MSFPVSFPYTEEFSKAGIDLDKLPVLELGDYTADYLHITRLQATQPIMRFKDTFGRHGIVISVRFRGDLAFGNSNKDPKPLINMSSGRLVIQERYVGGWWVVHDLDDNSFAPIIGVLNFIHRKYQDHDGDIFQRNCDSCPIVGQKLNKAFLIKLLKNRLPYLQVELSSPKEVDEQRTLSCVDRK